MKISRTPLRVSFLGGGTDYPQWFNTYGGHILGTSIDKYCYVMLHDGKCWHTFDLPNKSGLGSSSAYTVGLLRVSTELDKETIAKLATIWEQDKMNGNVGSQDQYLCAIGGFHELNFSEHGIRDYIVEEQTVKPLEKYLMLFDTQKYRRGSGVIVHQLEHLKRNRKLLDRLGAMVAEGRLAITQGDWSAFGKLLNEAWSLKKQLSRDVSTPSIDDIYEKGMKAGAIGGKLLGGGGGGFILFCVEPEKQADVRLALSNLTWTAFHFEVEGTRIIYNDNGRQPKS